MFINSFLILIIFCSISNSLLSKFNNQSEENDFYSKLLSNFQLSDSELISVNKLQKIIQDINSYEYHVLHNRNEVDYNTFDRSTFSFVTAVLRNTLSVVGVKNLFIALREGVSTVLTCFGCHTFASLLTNRYFAMETLGFSLYEVCSIFRLTTTTVCSGVVEQFKEQVDYIRHNTKLTHNEVCGVLLGTQCFVGQSKNLYWKIDVPKQIDNKLNLKMNKSIARTDENKIYQIMQITDIHLDSVYFSGGESDCGEPLCCRRTDQKSSVKTRAGDWGSYPCDMPVDTVRNAFTEMSRNAKNAELWYWTGDIVPHDVWMYDKNNNLMNSEIIAKFLDEFAQTPVILAVGNHETVPVNSFPPPSIKNKFSISWLYDYLANLWGKWLPEEALETFRYGGFYTMPVRPGFRVIVVNTNYCARLNIWSLYSPIDPADHLKWLINELLIAEGVDDKVHIVGHVPPDNRECTQAWLYNFLAIVERFKDTIVAQFYGHTHADEFRVFHSNKNFSDPIGFGFIAPSLTTYHVFNPAYRIYTTDQKGVITDVDTFFFNLTQANQRIGLDSEPELPVWYWEYSMSRNYSMTDFSYKGFNDLLKQLINNDNLLQIYHSLYFRYSDLTYNAYCDKICKRKLINDIIIGNPYEEKPKSITSIG